jgi:hypothetical protein
VQSVKTEEARNGLLSLQIPPDMRDDLVSLTGLKLEMHDSDKWHTRILLGVSTA